MIFYHISNKKLLKEKTVEKSLGYGSSNVDNHEHTARTTFQIQLQRTPVAFTTKTNRLEEQLGDHAISVERFAVVHKTVKNEI